MSEIVVRPYEPKDQEETWHVRAMTYNSGHPIPLEQQVYKTATPFVGEVNGRVVGTYVVMDMTLTRGPRTAWKAGGIAGVAVLPEARQSGIGSAMMRWALRNMREQGYVFAALYGFRESYYRRFGYETCGMRYKVTCPNSRLPRTRADLPVAVLPNSEFHRIKPCYEAFARARSGMNLREDFHWGRILNESRHIYAAGDPIEAYAIVEHDVDFWTDQPIAEFVWTTRHGYESIHSLFASIGINKSAVIWNEPADSPFLARYTDPGVKFEPDRPIMYRVLDFSAALASLASDEEGRFTVAVEDYDIAENRGPWSVRFGGETEVEHSDTAELTMDSQAAVQALLGQPSLQDLVRNGIVHGDSDDAKRLLTAMPVTCMDFF